MNEEVNPVVSEYMKSIRSLRTDSNYGFNDPEVARKAQAKSAETKRIRRAEAVKKQVRSKGKEIA